MQMRNHQSRRMIPCGSKNLPGFSLSFITSFAKANASPSRSLWHEPLHIFLGFLTPSNWLIFSMFRIKSSLSGWKIGASMTSKKCSFAFWSSKQQSISSQCCIKVLQCGQDQDWPCPSITVLWIASANSCAVHGAGTVVDTIRSFVDRIYLALCEPSTILPCLSIDSFVPNKVATIPTKPMYYFSCYHGWKLNVIVKVLISRRSPWPWTHGLSHNLSDKGSTVEGLLKSLLQAKAMTPLPLVGNISRPPSGRTTSFCMIPHGELTCLRVEFTRIVQPLVQLFFSFFKRVPLAVIIWWTLVAFPCEGQKSGIFGSSIISLNVSGRSSNRSSLFVPCNDKVMVCTRLCWLKCSPICWRYACKPIDPFPNWRSLRSCATWVGITIWETW